jgi:hypothetical protein
MEIKINLTTTEHKDLLSYCNLNDLLISSVVKDSFTVGFNIERYGLLNAGVEAKEKEVIKEVIKYVEVPVVEEKEVVRIEYVEIEKPIETIKEVQVEKIVEVIREVPVERVVEKIVEVIKEVPVDKVVIKEVVKEVPVEKVVTKIEYISDNTQTNELLLKIQELENRPPETVEVIKEVPVEVEVIREVTKEVEVIREVIKEVVVEKETTDNSLKPKLEALQNTVQKLKQDNIEKDKQIREYEKTIEDIQKFNDDKKALFLKGSNLDDKLYR